MYQLVHSVHYNLQVFESVNLSFDKKKILPFLTAAQRKHVQIHVMKTCRQASVTNSVNLELFLLFFQMTTQP